jgi:Domain of unknown function (DUF4424)
MWYRLVAAVMCAIALQSSQSLANDSTAEMGAGGIELVRNDWVRMAKEDLYLSPTEVRVDYVFESSAEKPRDLLVAFPMPDIRPIDYLEGDVGIPNSASDNFLNFTITADGKPIAPSLEIRALTYGIDITDELKSLGLPLSPFAEQASDLIAKLPEATRQSLRTRGIVSGDYGGDALSPSWTLKSTYYWTQNFPAKGKVAISHTYTPAVGSSFFYPANAEENGERDDFCIDAGTDAAIAKSLKASKQEFMLAHTLSYILITANNWAETIGDFRLVIDKKDQANFVSTCLDGLKKIGPTQFELRKTDFTPDDDLKILFLEPFKPEQ